MWTKNPPTDQDPKATRWLKGPASVGERAFSLPKPDGEAWDYTPADMVDDKKLGYAYDDLSSGVPADSHKRRIQRLGAPMPVAAMKAEAAVVSGKNVELLGASPTGVELKGSETTTAVALDISARKKVKASLSAVAKAAAPAPDRVFLNLENVTGLADATAFKVYVGLPAGADPVNHADKLAGSIALFGVTSASDPDGDHGARDSRSSSRSPTSWTPCICKMRSTWTSWTCGWCRSARERAGADQDRANQHLPARPLNGQDDAGLP